MTGACVSKAGIDPVYGELQSAVATLPPGRYAVGVSGGADSVALLTLLARFRRDLILHVTHLDHELRGAASAADADFVARLAQALDLPCTVERRSRLNRVRPFPRGHNVEADARAARLALHRRVVGEHRLRGVILAHHADDQAETVLFRLLRGGGDSTLRGMAPVARVEGLTIHRPLLGIRRARLREWLQSIGQGFHEDATNSDARFARNRIRRVLGCHPDLVEPLLGLGEAVSRWDDWACAAAPTLPASFSARQLAELPDALAVRSATRWLHHVAGCPLQSCDRHAAGRLIAMARDAAVAGRQDFPGGARVVRCAGAIAVRAPAASPSAGRGRASGSPPALPGS